MVDKHPRNWAICTIHDLIGKDGIFSDGDWVESKDQDPSGSVRLIQLADVGVGEFKDKSSRFLTQQKAAELNCTFLEAGDVLISRLPDPLGKCCLFPLSGDQAFVTAVDVSIVRLHREVDPTWFVYFFNAPPIKHQIYQHQTGTTRKRISRNNLGKINLALPPKDEQRRIVAKIEELFSELDKGVESLKTARAQIKTYRQSLLKAAFEGRLTEQWRRDNADKLETADQLLQRIREEREARYQQQLEEWKAAVAEWESEGKTGKKPRKPAAPKELGLPDDNDVAELPELPNGWFWTWLGNAAEVAGGLTKNQKRQHLPLKRPFLRVANVYSNQLILDEVHEVGLEETEADKVTLELGDLLVVEGNGSMDQIGRVAVWNGSIENCVHQNHLIRARFTHSVLSQFVLWFLLGKQGRDLIVRTASSTSGLHTLSISKVEHLLIPLCSVDEQAAVLEVLNERLSQVDELERTIEASLQKSGALRQSILKRAFEGKLAPQDPNDELAGALLERIRQEQADAPGPKRRPRNTGATA